VSDFIAERIWPDARVERSIFGTDDPEKIWTRALKACPDAVECFAFRVSVGALFGLRLRDGSRIALKIHGDRSDDRYLAAMQRVQRHLWEGGFPCPKPLGIRPRATIEEWVDAGEYRDAHEPAVRRVLAEQLSELVRRTAELDPLERMKPFFPTAGGELWPKPHNVLVDFEATSEGAAWIDEIAQAARERRDASVGRLVVGHGDWAASHFRFEGLRPTVVYDWDSLATDYEPVFAGGAAASFTYTEHFPVHPWPDLDEARAFLEEYERARGTAFTDAERSAAEAAVVYARGYTTRCVHALGEDATAMDLAQFAAALL
jgi:Phosphotransferase enzyme family